jgi:hypothetical protein
MRSFLVLCSVLALVVDGNRLSAAEALKLPAVKDNSIVLVDGEWGENAGQKARIRIKANQHIVAMAFDMTPVEGKLVKKATLVCVQSEQQISGVTISTIATPWDENRSNGLTAGMTDVEDWGYAGARFPAVIGGNGHTLISHVPSVLRDGRYHWDITPDMVHAMAIGVAHGIAIHEDDADVGRNPTIFSREQSGKEPYLLVEIDDATSSEPLPKPPTELQVVGKTSTSAILSLRPAMGFAYEVQVDGKRLGQHNIPFVSSAHRQIVYLRDISATVDDSHRVHVVTLNRTGKRSEAVEINSKIYQRLLTEKPGVSISPASKLAIANLSVIPLTDKYDETGKAVGALPQNYRTHNSIYDGQVVRLSAAAGEVVGFQVLLRGKDQVSVQAKLDDEKFRIHMYQAVYVPANGRRIPDPLLPMPKTTQLRLDADHSVVVDAFIPFDTKPGIQKGSITITDGRTVPIELQVLPFALPKSVTFACEMNGYGLPDHVDDYFALQQVAYDHRVHANILHYSHNTAAAGARKSNLDMRLRSGKRMDNNRYDDIKPNATTAYWDDFAEAFGPFLDGSLFKDGHRGPVYPPGFYLTFHESWPLNCRPYFNGNLDAYQAFSDDLAYEETYHRVLSSFRELAREQQWTQAGFQVYFNNKGSLIEKTKSPWILDEPSSYWDYRALRFFGELTDRSRQPNDSRPAGNQQARVRYRIDISRPEFCRGQLDGRSDLWVVSSSAFQQYRRLVMDRMAADGLDAWIYGTSNHVHESNRNIEAWALDAWQYGAAGIVPWQTINKTGSALKEADQLGLFIYDKNEKGQTVVYHSLRLKAYRESQQLIEYLNLLKQRRGWSRDQMQQFVNQYVQLGSSVQKVNEADAGTSAYAKFSASDAELLKLATVKLIGSN